MRAFTVIDGAGSAFLARMTRKDANDTLAAWAWEQSARGRRRVRRCRRGDAAVRTIHEGAEASKIGTAKRAAWRAARRGLAASLAAWAALPAGAAGQERPPELPDSLGQTFVLEGRVLDAVNERPVIAAVVKVPDLKRYTFTDVDGRFSFSDFPAGTREIVVEQLGYHTTEGPVTVSQGNGLFIRLEPDPIAIEGLRVRPRSERLLTNRRRSIPYRVETLGAETFARAVNPDPTVVLKYHSGAPIVPCPGDTSLIFGCVLRKGQPGGISVYLDEGPLAGGMEVLSTFPLEDIHSMDLILLPAGGMLRVYTQWFIERLDETRVSLAPLVW